MVFGSVILYTRPGCHLCEEAQILLSKHGLEPELVDIDAHPEYRARYTDCVPVVVIDGQVRFRGRINEVLLRRLLQSQRCRPTPLASVPPPSACSLKPTAKP